MDLNEKQELKELVEQYEAYLREVNLLLYKEHQLRLEQRIYTQQLQSIQKMIQQTNQPQTSNQLSSESQQKYLRNRILENRTKILSLENRLKSKQALTKQAQSIQQQKNQYIKIIQVEFQNSIQQKLSTIRGKVDELKKKIKEINKEIISLQQEHFEEIDEYSLNVKLLKEYREKSGKLRVEIEELRAQANK